MKRNASILILLPCFLILAAVIPAYGQIGDDLTSLHDAIQRNAELLDTARELVRETNSVKARASLAVAEKLHQQSLQYLRSEQYLAAAETAKRAREVIHQTIALAKREARLEENAAKTIERATNRLDYARQLLGETRSSVSEPARKILEESHGQLRRARDNMREHLYEVALRLAVSSIELSNRAVNLLKQDSVGPDAVLQEIERTDQALERLRERMSGDVVPSVRHMFEEASELQQKAKRSYQDGHYRIAIDLTRKSRNMAMRAFRLGTGETPSETVEQALQLTDMLLREAREIAAEKDSDRLDKHIEQAADMQMKAKEQFRQGNFDTALKLTLRARSVLKDALGDVRRDLNKDRVQAVLLETDGVLARLEEELSNSENDTAKEILGRAKSQQDRAWEEFDNDNLRAALAHTKLARNLARRASARDNDDEL